MTPHDLPLLHAEHDALYADYNAALARQDRAAVRDTLDRAALVHRTICEIEAGRGTARHQAWPRWMEDARTAIRDGAWG